MNKASTKKTTTPRKLADLDVKEGAKVLGGAPLTYKLVYNRAS